MTEEEYQEFLKQAPKNHYTGEFLQFLRDKNKVVEETWDWLIIRNKKYWTPENDWLTAYYKHWTVAGGVVGNNTYLAVENLKCLPTEYFRREWKIKAPHKRSVGLFHIHLIEKPQQNVV